MATSLVYSLLGSYLKLVLKDFGREQMMFSFGKGEIVMRNMQLQEKVLHYIMHLPPVLKVQHASCKTFKVVVPWRHMKQQPIAVVLEDIAVVVTETAEPEWQYSSIPLIDNIASLVFMGGRTASMRDALMQRIFEDITLQLVGVNMSLRFLAQDRASPGPTVTIALGSLVFRTTDSRGRVVPLSQARAEGATKTTQRIYKELSLGETAVHIQAGGRDLDVVRTPPITGRIISDCDTNSVPEKRICINFAVPDVPVHWNATTWPGFLETATAAIWCFREGYSFKAPPPPQPLTDSGRGPQPQPHPPQHVRHSSSEKGMHTRRLTPTELPQVRAAPPQRDRSGETSSRTQTPSVAGTDTDTDSSSCSQFDMDENELKELLDGSLSESGSALELSPRTRSQTAAATARTLGQQPSRASTPTQGPRKNIPRQPPPQQQQKGEEDENKILTTAIATIAAAQWPLISVEVVVDHASIEFENVYKLDVNAISFELHSELLPNKERRKLPANARPLDNLQFSLKLAVPSAVVESRVPSQVGLKVLSVRNTTLLDVTACFRPSLLIPSMTRKSQLPYLDGVVTLGHIDIQLTFELFDKLYEAVTCFVPSRKFHGVDMSNLELLVWWVDRCNFKAVMNGVTLTLVNPKQSMPASIVGSVGQTEFCITPSDSLVSGFTNRHFQKHPHIGTMFSYTSGPQKTEAEEEGEEEARPKHRSAALNALEQNLPLREDTEADKSTGGDCYFLCHGSLHVAEVSLLLKPTKTSAGQDEGQKTTEENNSVVLGTPYLSVDFDLFRPSAFVSATIAFLKLEKKCELHESPETLPAVCAQVFVPGITSNIEQTAMLRVWPLLLDYVRWGTAKFAQVLEFTQSTSVLELVQNSIGVTVPARAYITAHVGSSTLTISASERSCRSLIELAQNFDVTKNLADDLNRFEELLSQAFVDDFSQDDVTPLLSTSLAATDFSFLRSLLIVRQLQDTEKHEPGPTVRATAGSVAPLLAPPDEEVAVVFYETSARLAELSTRFVPNRSFPLRVEVCPLQSTSKLRNVFPSLDKEIAALEDIDHTFKYNSAVTLNAKLVVGESLSTLCPVVHLQADNYTCSSQGNPLPLLKALKSIINKWKRLRLTDVIGPIEPGQGTTAATAAQAEAVVPAEPKQEDTSNSKLVEQMRQLARKLVGSGLIDYDATVRQTLSLFGAFVTLSATNMQVCHTSCKLFDDATDKPDGKPEESPAQTADKAVASPPLKQCSESSHTKCSNRESDQPLFPSFSFWVAPCSSAFALSTVRDAYEEPLSIVAEKIAECEDEKQEQQAECISRTIELQESQRREEAERLALEETTRAEYGHYAELERDVAVYKQRISRADELSKTLRLFQEGRPCTHYLKQCSQALSSACIPETTKEDTHFEEQKRKDLATMVDYEQETEKMREEMLAEIAELEKECAENERLLNAARDVSPVCRVPVLENMLSEACAHVGMLEQLTHTRYESTPVAADTSARPRHFLSVHEGKSL